MTIQETDITKALDGKTAPDDAVRIARILCRGPGGYVPVRVIDDGAAQPDDGHPESPAMVAPCRPAEHPEPDMSELPSYLFSMPWLRQELRTRLGPAAANHFYSELSDMSGAAREAAYLAAVLREAYGPDGLAEAVDAAVFAQPAYAPFRNALLPVLEQCVYA